MSLVSTELGGGDSGNDSAMKGRRLRDGSSWLSKVFRNEQEDRGGDRGSSRKDEHTHVSASGPRAVMTGLPQGLTCKQEVAVSHQVPEESTLTWFFPSRPPLEQSKPAQGAPALGGAQHHQILWCHKVARVSAVREKPRLSILGVGWFHLDFLTQEKEGREAARKES